jgi:hypothetical protein
MPAGQAHHARIEVGEDAVEIKKDLDRRRLFRVHADAFRLRKRVAVTFDVIFADGTRRVLLARQNDAASCRIGISGQNGACAKTGIGLRGGRVFTTPALHFQHQNASKRNAAMPHPDLPGRCGDRKIRAR